LGDPESPILGRNYDNNDDRGVLVGLYTPSDGYASICISNMYHMGFDKGEDPTLLQVESRRLLLNSALFVEDGINERGVSVALATGEDALINRDENKKLISLSYLMREILDHAGNVDEAADIVRSYDVFDKNNYTISNHLLISGPFGKSVIAEYYDGEWRIIPNDKSWQVVTNTLLFNVPEETRKNECSRYETAYTNLEKVDGQVDWEEGMNILSAISVEDTQWSTIYDMNRKEVYISLYRGYSDIRKIKIR